MPSPPAFGLAALASTPPAGDIYFPSELATPAGAMTGFAAGSPVVNSANTAGIMGPAVQTVHQATGGPAGSWREVLNFHGSAAPWVLIGILLVFGLMQLEAKGRVGRAKASLEI